MCSTRRGDWATTRSNSAYWTPRFLCTICSLLGVEMPSKSSEARVWSFVLLNAKAIECIKELPFLQLLPTQAEIGRFLWDGWHGDPCRGLPCVRCETYVYSSLNLSLPVLHRAVHNHLILVAMPVTWTSATTKGEQIQHTSVVSRRSHSCAASRVWRPRFPVLVRKYLDKSLSRDIF